MQNRSSCSSAAMRSGHWPRSQTMTMPPCSGSAHHPAGGGSRPGSAAARPSHSPAPVRRSRAGHPAGRHRILSPGDSAGRAALPLRAERSPVARQGPRTPIKQAVATSTARQRSAIKHEQQAHAQGIDIAAGIGCSGFVKHLGRDIQHRANEGARRRAAGRVLGQHQIKVGQVGLSSAVEQDVLRLHIAVHQPAGMRVLQRLTGLQHRLERVGTPDATFLERALQITAREVVHDVVVEVLVISGLLQYADDVRVGKLAHDASPAEKALGAAQVFAATVQDLDGDKLLSTAVERLPDIAVATASDELAQDVTLCEDLAGIKLRPAADLALNLDDLAIQRVELSGVRVSTCAAQAIALDQVIFQAQAQGFLLALAGVSRVAGDLASTAAGWSGRL